MSEPLLRIKDLVKRFPVKGGLFGGVVDHVHAVDGVSFEPINPLEDRLAVIAALESVCLATWFDEDTPLALILAAQPDVLVKGGDWTPETIVGAKEVLGWGGAVHSLPFEHERSTSALLARIKNTNP